MIFKTEKEPKILELAFKIELNKVTDRINQRFAESIHENAALDKECAIKHAKIVEDHRGITEIFESSLQLTARI